MVGTDEDVVNTEVHRSKRSASEQPQVPSPVYEVHEEDSEEAADDSAAYLHHGDAVGESQNFFPSYYPSFANSRQHHAYASSTSQRPALQRSNNFQPIGFLHQAQADSSGQDNLLGSGNFGVIRGGTYYNDKDNEQGQSSDYDNRQAYTPYYHNNGHGRPAFYKGGGTNPRPQHQTKDFFANFRDFADINTPTKASYSELYVVYVNKNASRHDQEPTTLVRGDKPRNIIEQLALIDMHEKKEPKVPEKKTKLSAGKLKLARTFKTKQDKVKKATSPKELYEPLLALS